MFLSIWTIAQRKAVWLGLILLCWFNPTPVLALSQPLRVGTKPFSPFAFVQDGQYIGFSIDLWQKIAQELELEYELYGEETVTDLLNSVSEKNTDVAIAGITITAEREKIVDLHCFLLIIVYLVRPTLVGFRLCAFVGIPFSP